ncbi:PepSY domain-containing protein [Streptomyces sp. DW26H14]|uniref:PepSY domain-containing protein n=1 Tax=Streptomyces sp. DW26H14 TaxID=3435395 RepID=UPI00403DA286
MKRNIVIAAVAAAVLIGGGTYSAVALTGGDGGSGADTSASGSSTSAAGTAPATGAGGPLTADGAARAALRAYPGTVVSVEREDGGLWEVELRTKGRGAAHELDIDASTGAVRKDERDPGDDGDGLASLAGARLTASEAARAARTAVPGTVTSVEVDDHHAGVWEVGVRPAHGGHRDLRVDARTGAVTARPQHDDGHDGDDDRSDRDDSA